MRTVAGGGGEVRCPSCSRPLVLRSGPTVTPHFAHRPRQSCRRPGPAGLSPLRVEQLTLFDPTDLTRPAAPPPARPPLRFPVGDTEPPAGAADQTWTAAPAGPSPAPNPRRSRQRRRRRRAWLPRLVRWIRRQPSRR